MRAAAPRTGGEIEEEDKEEGGNREGFFCFFFALGVNIHIIFFQGVHSNTVHDRRGGPRRRPDPVRGGFGPPVTHLISLGGRICIFGVRGPT